MTDLKITLSENPNPRYLYVSPDNIVHLMVPIIAADASGIGTDNTCKSVIALQNFFGKGAHSSAINELQAYRVQLENDIKTLNEYQRDPSKEQARLKQVGYYIEALQTITNLYDHSLDRLNGMLPTYPDFIKHLLAQTNSNVYSMFLQPEPDREDDWISTSSPLFRVNRLTLNRINSVLRTELSTALARITDYRYSGKLPKEIFADNVADKLTGITYPVALFDIKKQLSDVLIAELATISEAKILDESDIDQKLIIIGWEIYSRNIDDDEKVQGLNDLKEIINGLLGGLECMNYPESTDSIKSTYNTLRDQTDRSRAEAANMMTQFFLAEINIYAHSHNILHDRTNMGAVLDGDSDLSSGLAKLIADALTHGLHVETQVYNFINQNHATFGLTQELSARHQQEISNLFSAHYQTIADLAVKDEFIIIDTSKTTDVEFVFHQHAICCDFTKILNLPTFSRLYSEAKFGDVSRNTKKLNVILPARDENDIATLELDGDSIKILINVAIAEHDESQLRKLLLKVNDEYVFKLLGKEFFNQFYSNETACSLLRNVRTGIVDSIDLNTFNQIVLGEGSQLTVNERMARSLYNAVQDRKKLPLNRLLKYTSSQDLKNILQDLTDLGASIEDGLSSDEHEFRSLIRRLNITKVSQDANGRVIIYADDESLENLNKVIARYENTLHIPTAVSESIYKDIVSNERPGHNFLMLLKDNGVPERLREALHLLHFNIPDSNIIPTKTESNGYIINNIDSDTISAIERIYENYANKLSIPWSVRQAIFAQVAALNASHIVNSYTRTRDQLRAALILLGIKCDRIIYNYNNYNEQSYTIYLSPEEQAKIKKINKLQNSSSLLNFNLNEDDEEYTKDYVPALITPSARLGSLADVVGNIIDGILTLNEVIQNNVDSDDDAIADIEPMERQTNRMILDAFFEIAVYDVITESDDDEAHEILEDCGEDRRLKFETALLLIGIDVTQVILNETTSKFIITADLTEQSKIKKVLKNSFLGTEIDASIMDYTTDDIVRTQNYAPDVVNYKEGRFWNLRDHIDDKRNQLINGQSAPTAPADRDELPNREFRWGNGVESFNNDDDDLSSNSTSSTDSEDDFRGWRPIATDPRATRNTTNHDFEVTEIQGMISDLVRNINSKSNGRQVEFTYNTDSKVNKLNAVLKYLGNVNSFNVNERYAVLKLVRDICAIKRNPLGFFAPHSLTEFDNAVQTIAPDLVVSTPGDYKHLSLSRINDDTVGSYIDELMSQMSQVTLTSS